MKSLITQFFKDIQAYKMRIFLALFGVAWGTITIVLLMSFGAGMEKQAKIGFQELGEHVIILWGKKTSKPYRGLRIGRKIRFTEDDVNLLKKNVKGISMISPELIKWDISIKYRNELVNSNIIGVNQSYSKIRNLSSKHGRFINKIDIDNKKKVVFLGNKVKEQIFDKEDGIGKSILINGIPFSVIGVMQKKNQIVNYSGMDEQNIFIPFSTFKTVFGCIYLNDIICTPKDRNRSSQIIKEVLNTLSVKHKFDPKDDAALRFWDIAEDLKLITNIGIGIKIFLAFVGTLTLIIAGSGVANVMYIIVDERTREIGIRRAVGATSRNILTHFLSETLIISLTGGIIGIIVSFFIVWICSFIPEIEIIKYIGRPFIAPSIPIATVIILLIISLLAGFFPAKKAAKLNPVECLQHE